MADCTVENQKLIDAKSAIDTSAKNLEEAGTTFKNAFNKAIEDMSGEAYDELSSFFKTTYEPLVSGEKSIATMVTGLGQLLETNRVQFAQTDHNIAEQIRQAKK